MDMKAIEDAMIKESDRLHAKGSSEMDAGRSGAAFFNQAMGVRKSLRIVQRLHQAPKATNAIYPVDKARD
jgi:hypothetical protein